MSDNVVDFPPRDAKRDDDELLIGIALGQAHAIVQLLLAAAGQGRIKVNDCDDTLDAGALAQALHAVDQELHKAREVYDRFLDGLAREAKP